MKKFQKDDKSKKDDYIEKMREWQEHQYDPGYYTGGNIPPVITHTGRPKLLGWVYVISSIVSAIIMIGIVMFIFSIEHIIPIILLTTFFYGLFIIQFFAGVRLIKRGKTETYPGIKKNLLRICFGIVVILVLFLAINSIFLEKVNSIVVNNEDNILFLEEYNKSYLVLNDRKLVLECNESDYLDVMKARMADGKESFNIKYEWNLLKPHKGKAIKVENID
ncbi:MAG: hypothetical protein K0R84_329 [Clostridia bacterium]|jgi:hypothetical protein|nr:hypothetical protein [Clostridia bacterium]